MGCGGGVRGVGLWAAREAWAWACVPAGVGARVTRYVGARVWAVCAGRPGTGLGLQLFGGFGFFGLSRRAVRERCGPLVGSFVYVPYTLGRAPGENPSLRLLGPSRVPFLGTPQFSRLIACNLGFDRLGNFRVEVWRIPEALGLRARKRPPRAVSREASGEREASSGSAGGILPSSVRGGEASSQPYGAGWERAGRENEFWKK